MKRLISIASLVLSLAAGGAAFGKPSIRILATGGTIAGAQSNSQSYGYKSGSFKVEDLIGAVPQLKEIATLTGEQVANIGSQDMNDAIWLKLSERVNQVLAAPDVDGVVITHGTDTMEETAFFLDLTVKSEKPVVLVGSMRPATAISADGPGNLFNAVSVAASPSAKGRGVMVVLNDEVHAARNVVKTDTTNVDTFKSMNRGPVGLVHTGKIAWFEHMDRPHTTRSEFDVSGRGALPRVDIIYAHANMSPDLIDAAVKDGAKGLVVAGVGDGNMTQQAVAALTRAAKGGVAVVRSTRLTEGLVLRNNEVNDDQMGFAASGEFTAPKARVLLQLALTRTADIRQIQRMFDQY
jgi:L-asparaginase